MSLRTLFLMLVSVLLAVFVFLNWSAFMTPTTLSLLFATVEAPLGLLMLGVTALLAAFFLTYLVYIQTTVLLDMRRTARELKAQRDLANQAETSRFTDLHNFLETRMQKLEAAVTEAQSHTGTRLDQLEGDLRSAVEHAANTLSSYIGELEDRMERHTSDAAVKPAT
ncbi:MAG: LapA family protein [Burkholderiaceae bacterium]